MSPCLKQTKAKQTKKVELMDERFTGETVRRKGAEVVTLQRAGRSNAKEEES